MAKQVQLRRGTTAELSSVTGAIGEVIVDTTKDTLTVHDGYTAGGTPLLKEDLGNLANNSIGLGKIATGTHGQVLYYNASGQLAVLNPGTAGYVLATGGAGVNPSWVNASGRLLAINSYTNDAGGATEPLSNCRIGGTWTWTKPEGCRYVLVYCTGAGAGSASNDTSYRGWAGGAGATAIGWYDVTSVNTVTVTTGTGSTAVNSASTATSQGGASSFGSFCTAYGGYGPMAEYPHSGGRGGYSVGGNILNIHGGAGQGSHSSDFEGGGGASFWYAGGGQHHNGTGQGDTEHTRYRTLGRFGGGGGFNYGSQYTTDYRAGGAGLVVVYAYS